MTETEKIATDIMKLPQPDRLRLAAELLQLGKVELAYTIIDGVKVELGAALLEKRGG